MKLLTDKLLGCVFCGWLGLFWLSYWVGDPVPATVGNRPLAAFPQKSAGVLSSVWLQKVAAWGIDHSPFRLRTIVERNRLLYAAARTLQPVPVSPGSSEICVGRDGWLSFMDEAQDRRSRHDQEKVVGYALEIARAVKASGRRFCLMPIPDKYSVYPEHAATILHWADPIPLREQRWAALQKGFDEAPDVRSCYLPLLPAYSEARRQGAGLLYWEVDTHWNYEGMRVALPLLLEHLQPGLWDPQAVHPQGVIEHHNGDLMYVYLLQPTTMVGTNYGIARAEPVRMESFLVAGSATGTISRFHSDDPRTFKGRTLIIIDSFMAGAVSLFAPWFEDVTFAHFDCNGSPELADRISQCDTLVFTSVERLLRWRLGVWGSHDRDHPYLMKALAAHPKAPAGR